MSDLGGDPSARRHELRVGAGFAGWRFATGVVLALLASTTLGCSRAASAPPAAASASPASAAAIVALGAKLFTERSLSASGQQSCASCHDPAHGHTSADGGAIQRGGADLKQPGLRAIPSLRYTLARTPAWFKEYQSNAVERMLEVDSLPIGGFGWDGRFNTLREQARFPLLAANEMANAGAADFAARLAHSALADDFRHAFGNEVFSDPERTLAMATLALERFELSDAGFAPYSSRYDDYLDGKLQLTVQEQRGLQWFTRPDKGNCAACHTAARGADGSHPLFTDFSFQTLGVPRNRKLAANADPAFHDLGLCGPLRNDQAGVRGYCGMFRTPSLRNVAARRAFFHNARFTTLREAVEFYFTRDSDAQRWYPRHGGQLDKYDDLPPALRSNVDHFDAPFNRKGQAGAALNAAQINDLLAFLGTLTDRDVAATLAAQHR